MVFLEGEGAISPDTAKKATPYSLIRGGAEASPRPGRGLGRHASPVPRLHLGRDVRVRAGGRAGPAVQRGAAASDSPGSESDSDATVELAG